MLPRIIKFIENEQKEAELISVKIVSPNNLNLFIKQLSKIKTILSSDTQTLLKLKTCLNKLESREIVGFLGIKSNLRSLIKNEGLPVLSNNQFTHPSSCKFFPNCFYSSFKKIHAQLFKCYSLLTPKWLYSFPLINGQVMNKSIRTWQKTLTKYNGTRQAYVDFERNITIDGLEKNSTNLEEAISLAIKNLILHSAYPKDQHEALIEWISENGGQDINRFIHQLFLTGALSNLNFAIGNAKAITQHWSVDISGKIFCKINYNIFSLLQDDGSLIFLDTNPNILYLRDYGSRVKNISTYADQTEHLPLLQIEAQVTINTNETIHPEVTLLKVTGYSNYIQPTATLNNPNSKIPTEPAPLTKVKIR